MTTSRQLHGKSPSCARRIPQFSYDSLSSSVANFLKGQADRIRRGSTLSAIQIGKGLISAKHYLSHGDFIRWVEGEIGIPARTAQGYMQIVHWTADKSATIAHLSPTFLYLLSASSTPDEFTRGLVKRVEQGERISLPTLRAELRAFRRENPDGTRVAENDDKAEIIAAAPPCEETLTEFVAILVRRLSKMDFARLREIMTSESVLSDPWLARTITDAFSARSNGKGPEIDQQTSLAA
jgi:hypothetical protein